MDGHTPATRILRRQQPRPWAASATCSRRLIDDAERFVRAEVNLYRAAGVRADRRGQGGTCCSALYRVPARTIGVDRRCWSGWCWWCCMDPCIGAALGDGDRGRRRVDPGRRHHGRHRGRQDQEAHPHQGRAGMSDEDEPEPGGGAEQRSANGRVSGWRGLWSRLQATVEPQGTGARGGAGVARGGPGAGARGAGDGQSGIR